MTPVGGLGRPAAPAMMDWIAPEACALLAPQADELGLRHLHLLGHQASANGRNIVGHHAADVVQRLPDSPGSMGGKDSVPGIANGMILWQRSLGEDIDARLEPAVRWAVPGTMPNG